MHCNNRGVCMQIMSPMQQRICTCNPNYIGTLCQLENPCHLKKQCVHGTCFPVLNATANANRTGGEVLESADFTCQCYLGYAGRHCDEISNYDPCSSNPCHLNGACVTLENNRGYICIKINFLSLFLFFFNFVKS